MDTLLEEPGALGELARHVMNARSEGQPGPEETGRQRDLLPLPWTNEAASFLTCRAATAEWWTRHRRQAGRAQRKLGIAAWMFVIVVGLNFMWFGCKFQPFHYHEPHEGQRRALDRIRLAAMRFVDEMSMDKTPELPRTPPWDWLEKLKGKKVSYTGEVLEVAQTLTLEEVLPALPPAGTPISEVLSLCSQEVRDQLEFPDEQFLPEAQHPEVVPQAKVHASQEEWNKIVQVCVDRGVMEVVDYDSIPLVRGRPLLNGAFGVLKQGKVVDGHRVLRLIMNLTPANMVLRTILGDIETLAGPSLWTATVLEDDEIALISGDDLVCSFYLFKLPAGWSKYFCFSLPVAGSVLGRPEAQVWVGAAVIPMGWASAVGVMQHLHRSVLLRPYPGGAGYEALEEMRRDREFPLERGRRRHLWNVYLDDTTSIELVNRERLRAAHQHPGRWQVKAREAYDRLDIPWSRDKTIEGQLKVERLGATFDGAGGTLGTSVQRALEVLSLGYWLIGEGLVSKKWLQIYAGKEVHSLQFRRPLFSIYDELWATIGRGLGWTVIRSPVRQEMLCALALLPMRLSNLRAGLDGEVTASDASLSGGGLVASVGLTAVGEAALRRPAPEGSDIPVVAVIGWFDGIGGLRQALDRLGLEVALYISIEIDAGCRRVVRHQWPSVVEFSDMTKVESEQLTKLLAAVPGLQGIIQGGGSPCQGLSRVNAHRKHFEDERSVLFYTLAKKLKEIERWAEANQIWSLSFVENVVGDDRDRDEMSQVLGWRPVRCNASCLSRVRRPRYYWFSRQLEQGEFILKWFEGCDEVEFVAGCEPTGWWLSPGAKWPGGRDTELRFPTCTRSIPRTRPPPSPAGIHQCSMETLELWRNDQYKYPPYTYQEQFRIYDRFGPRVLNSDERELLAGFPRGHTRPLRPPHRAAQHPEELEVARCAAVGNSFHTGVVAALLSSHLFQMQVLAEPVTAEEIVSAWTSQPPNPSPEAKKVKKATTAKEEENSEGELVEEAEAQLYFKEGLERKDFCYAEEPLPAGLPEERLVEAFLRRVEHRGSDVRLDVGTLFRPIAWPRMSIEPDKWRWVAKKAIRFKKEEHINCLEIRMYLYTLRWKLRRVGGQGRRVLHFMDSQVGLAVITKGRSSSKKINQILRRIGALSVAGDVYGLLGYVSTDTNPADEPSRRFEPCRRKDKS